MRRATLTVLVLCLLPLACGDSRTTGSPGTDDPDTGSSRGQADAAGPAETPDADDSPDTAGPAEADALPDTAAPPTPDATPDVAAPSDPDALPDADPWPDAGPSPDVPTGSDAAEAPDAHDPPAPSDPGAVQLLDPLDEPERYCLALAGSGGGAQTESPLIAHTCKGGAPDDQTFVANDPTGGQLRMPGYDLCLEADGVYSTATVSPKPCSTSPMQLWRLRDDHRIQVHVLEPGLCIAVAPGDGAPANGPSHLKRDLALQGCDDVAPELSQWSVPGGALAPTDPPVACEELTGDIDAILAEHQTCGGPGECELFEYPICGSAGCYQRAVGDPASVPEEVWEIASIASALHCEPFHCGCGYAASPACLDGTCELCPGPGCALDCDALIALLVAEVELQTACTSDNDCGAVATPLCTVPELGCYQAAVTWTGTWGIIPTLVQMITDQGCALADCDCQDQSTACVDGTCVSQP